MHAVSLRYLTEVARLGSIRRAADSLNVASSAVNRQVLKLEAQIGAPLFERSRAGVRPTQAGEVLLRHVRETMVDYQRTLAEIAGLSGQVTGAVRILALESLALRFMPEVIEDLSARYPEVTFSVLVVDQREIADELRSERSDFGVLFIDRQLDGVDVVDEIRTATGALMRPDHPLAGRRRLRVADCAPYPLVMLHDRSLLDAAITNELAGSGARLAPRVVANSIEFIRHMMRSKSSIGGFVTPIGFLDEIRRGELVHVPLVEPRFSRIGVLVPRRRRQSPPALLAIDHIRSRLKAFGRELEALASGRRR
jgi:DNA-binding transcriptional LysR family regulator